LPRDDVDDERWHEQAEQIGAAFALCVAVGIINVPSPKQRKQEPQPTRLEATCGHLGDSEIIEPPGNQIALRQRGQQDQDAALALAQIELPCAGNEQRNQSGESE
jgi:hypothetical protein